MEEIREVLDNNVEAHDVEIDFGRIFRSLWHFAWLIVALAIIGASAMYAFSKFVLPPEYKSTASLYIHDKNVTSSAGGSVEGGDGTLNYNTIGGNAATFLKNTYERTLVSDTTLSIVIEKLGLEENTKSLRSKISSNVLDYPYLDITVTYDDAELSAAIANELADVLYEQVAKIVGGTALTHVDRAPVPSEKSGPDTLMNTLIGFAVGFAIGCVLIIVMELCNNRINNDEYLMNKYGISVLASISDAEETSRKRYQYYKKQHYYTQSQKGDRA